MKFGRSGDDQIAVIWSGPTWQPGSRVRQRRVAASVARVWRRGSGWCRDSASSRARARVGVADSPAPSVARITAVGDNSNLILDPDLDSFYVMDALVVQVPKALLMAAQVSAIIASINDYQLTIASAVEEQTATTNEMSRGVQEAATGSSEIAGNITGVASSADSSAQVLGQMGDSVAELARLSADLRTRVDTFTY
jgi:hypothetical protein